MTTCPTVLRMVLDYNPETGKMFWSDGARKMGHLVGIGLKAKPGKQAMTAKDKHGYHHGSVAGSFYKAHRVAWAIHTGEWPDGEVDHINGDRSDNRARNLRVVAKADNQKNMKRPVNNTSGHIGVTRVGRGWVAQIKVDRKTVRLGSFLDKSEAIRARKKAEREYGFHPNHGRPA